MSVFREILLQEASWGGGQIIFRTLARVAREDGMMALARSRGAFVRF
jgi:hypothetical protein